MSRRVVRIALVAWAVSPLLSGLLLALDAAWRGDHDAPPGAVTWSLDSGAGRGTMPTPDAVRSALRDDLPSGRILYHGLGRLRVSGPDGRQEGPVLWVELAAPGGAPQFAALRGRFFGPGDLDLDQALGSTLAAPAGAIRLVQAREDAAAVTLQLAADPAYTSASLVRAIEVRD